MLEGDPSAPTDKQRRVERELFLRAMSLARPPPEVARHIANLLRDVYHPAGTVLFQRGEAPKNGIFVVSGEVSLLGLDDEEDRVFEAGSLVGIIDLNIGRPRARTCVVTKDAHLLELPFDAWMEVLEDFPDYTSQARRIVAKGLHDVTLTLAPGGGFDQLAKPGPSAEDCEIVSRIVMLRRTRCFDIASVQALAEIAERGELLRPDPGELLVRPGTGRDRMYLVMRGNVHVERRIAPEIRASFGPGQIVLGGAAFCDALRSYAVIAGADAAVFAIDQTELDEISDDHFDIVRSIVRGMSLDRDQLVSIRSRAPTSSKRTPPASIK